ncbi:unnamed protein product, partial [Mesorhabditis spiculigera]
MVGLPQKDNSKKVPLTAENFGAYFGKFEMTMAASPAPTTSTLAEPRTPQKKAQNEVQPMASKPTTPDTPYVHCDSPWPSPKGNADK